MSKQEYLVTIKAHPSREKTLIDFLRGCLEIQNVSQRNQRLAVVYLLNCGLRLQVSLLTALTGNFLTASKGMN
jgi:hypothetical protein